MTKYIDIYYVVVFAIVVHAALTASLVNMFMTLSFVKRDVALQYGGPIDLSAIVGAEDSNWADGSDTDVVGKVEADVSLDKYKVSKSQDESHANTMKSKKAKAQRYMMW